MSDQELIAQLMTAAKVKRTAKNRTYVVSREGDKTVKLTPQAVECLRIVFSVGKDEIPEVELIEAFSKAEIKTKQDKFRIFQYYRKNLVEAGWITVK